MPLQVEVLHLDRSHLVVPLGIPQMVVAVLPRGNPRLELDPLDTLLEGGRHLVGGRHPVGGRVPVGRTLLLGVGSPQLLGQVHILLDH